MIVHVIFPLLHQQIHFKWTMRRLHGQLEIEDTGQLTHDTYQQAR